MRLCYRRSSVVCRSVCHNLKPCKNGWTDRDAVCGVESGGPKEPRIVWGTDPPCNFEGETVMQQMAGWKSKMTVFYNGIRALEKRRTKYISVAVNYAQKWKIWCTNLVITTNFLNTTRKWANVNQRMFWTKVLAWELASFSSEAWRFRAQTFHKVV